MSTLKWAGETLTKMCLQMVNEQRAPDRERWQTVMTGPVPPIEMFHPSPFTEGLLDGSRLPQSVEAPITRSLQLEQVTSGAVHTGRLVPG
jgi:hypothetical protein